MNIKKTLKIALKRLLDVKMGEIVTKENRLIFDGDVYGVGTEVFIEDTENEGEFLVAPDGEYTLIEDEDENEVMVIVVRDGKIEELREVENVVVEDEITVEAETEETVVEPADEVKDEEENKEDEKTAEEVEKVEDRMEEITKGIAEILNSIASIEGRIATLEEKMAVVEKEPAAEPADEKPEVEEKTSRMRYLRK